MHDGQIYVVFKPEVVICMETVANSNQIQNLSLSWVHEQSVQKCCHQCWQDAQLVRSTPISAQFFSSKLVPGCWRDGPCRPQRRLHGWMGRGSEGGRRGGGMRNSDLIEFWLRSFLLRCQCDNSDEVKKAGCVFESNLFTFFLLLVIPVGPCALILLATFWTLSCQLNKLGDLRISLDRITTPPQLPQVWSLTPSLFVCPLYMSLSGCQTLHVFSLALILDSSPQASDSGCQVWSGLQFCCVLYTQLPVK